MKHTQGTWFVTGEDAHTGDIPFIEVSRETEPGSNWKMICAVECSIVGPDEDFVLTEEDWANARLIAAAPELLKCLKKIDSEWDGEPEDMYDVRKLIAKIEHES